MARGGRRGHLILLIPSILSFLLEIAGIAAIVYGLFLLAPVVGFIGGGIGLILVGLALDPPGRAPKQIEANTE
jgi:hypothetical protein